MKKKNREEFNCIKSYPQCIQWNLGDIPSLGIENGDYLDTMVYAIANKLCDCCGETDLSGLSLQCLVDKLGVTEPVPRTIVTVLQLLIDNDCTLKDLIDNLQDQINDINQTNLVLDLKCLAEFDVYGNPLPYDLQSVLQKLISELCLLKDEVIRLGAVVIDLQDQIDAINIVPYELPTITTCVSANKKLDISVKDVATSLCSLRNATGTEVQLQSAMAFQCANFNQQFGTIVGWNPAPVNLAQSYANLEIAFCDVLNRLIIMEQTCCGPTCDKIKIGFGVEVDKDLKELTFCFTSGAGTYIPFGFYDCGSVITITDEEGNVATPQSTVITQEGCISGISYSSLVGKIFTVSIKTRFCLKDRDGNIILTCQDCLNKTIDTSAECPVCKVCVESDKTATNAYVDILYMLGTQYTSVRIPTGQCNYIPSDAIVVGINRMNGGIEQSDCLDTTNTEEIKCYTLSWAVTDNGNSQTEAWDNHGYNNKIVSLTALGNTYTLNTDIYHPEDIATFINASGAMNSVILNATSFSIAMANLYSKGFTFRTLPSIAENFYLSTNDVSGISLMRIYPVAIPC